MFASLRRLYFALRYSGPYCSVSTLAGWRTSDARGRLFGPAYNSATDLWDWQRTNLPR
jgi:hypothetical protein